MSLQTRLAALISAIGADIKDLNTKIPQVYVGANAPSPRGANVIWIDTDEVTPPNVAIPKVAVLPSSPYDGQEIYYVAEAINGVLWHLRHNAGSSSPYKWEFLGGSPLQTQTAIGVTVSGATFLEASDSVPRITLPLAGDYLGGFTVQGNTPSADGYYGVRQVIAATPSAPDHGVSAGANYNAGASGNELRWASQTAGSNMYLQFQSSGTSTITWRSIWIRPVRVGP